MPRPVASMFLFLPLTSPERCVFNYNMAASVVPDSTDLAALLADEHRASKLGFFNLASRVYFFYDNKFHRALRHILRVKLSRCSKPIGKKNFKIM